MQITFTGKTALITGGTSQLGRAMVRAFAASDADVAVHYYQNKTLAETLAQEALAMGVRAMSVQADVTNPSDVRAMRDAVAGTLGMPHIVVCNAVSQYPWKAILDQPPEDFRDQFDTCTMQNILMAQAFIPAMAARGTGRFIGINTECAMLCNPNSGAYAAAKRGMDGVYRTLAKEVGASGVTVNQVAPGWTISDRDRENGTAVQPDHDARIPLRHRGTDADIANAVLFLASDLAAYITGVYLPVAGGNVMPAI